MDVSFKAVLFNGDGQVLLGANSRSEWELLGGRADCQDSDPAATITREVREEAGIDAVVGELVDIWYYDIPNEGRVAVASYLASVEDMSGLVASVEHRSLRFFAPEEISALAMPEGYKSTIRQAAARRSSGTKEKR